MCERLQVPEEKLVVNIERYGNTGQLLGNPNLVPESGTNADVGANWTRKGERLRLFLDGALFAAWSRNLIYFRQLGGYTRPGNLGRARILGVETSVTVDWRGQFRFFGQTTFTDARDLEDVKARYPLAAAEVEVKEVAGNPGYYTSKFFLRPHYQLEGLTVSLRLVSKLPSVKK